MPNNKLLKSSRLIRKMDGVIALGRVSVTPSCREHFIWEQRWCCACMWSSMYWVLSYHLIEAVQQKNASLWKFAVDYGQFCCLVKRCCYLACERNLRCMAVLTEIRWGHVLRTSGCGHVLSSDHISEQKHMYYISLMCVYVYNLYIISISIGRMLSE